MPPSTAAGSPPRCCESGLAVELVETTGHAQEHVVADGCLFEHPLEGRLREQRERHRAQRGDGRVAGRRVEERELAEEVAGREAADFASPARDAPVALQDDEELRA